MIVTNSVEGRDRERSKSWVSIGQLEIAADERRAVALLGADPGGGVKRLPRLDRFGLALGRDRRELLVDDRSCARPVGSCSHGHPHHGSGGLQARGGVHRVPGREPFAGARIDVQADECLSGVHPDPDLDAEIGGSDVFGDPKRGPHRAFGIVLMGERDPEHPDDRVADELLDHPAVGLDAIAADRLVVAEQAGDVFCVQALPQGGRSDQVAEQRGDDLALLADRGGFELGAAVPAEPLLCRILRAAGRADEHGREPTLGAGTSSRGRDPRLARCSSQVDTSQEPFQVVRAHPCGQSLRRVILVYQLAISVRVPPQLNSGDSSVSVMNSSKVQV